MSLAPIGVKPGITVIDGEARKPAQTTPEEWFVIYALWFIVMGCTFFSLAANAGIWYLTGSLCFLLAVLAPLVPFYLPLIGGSLISLNMTTVGLVLRRVAREATSR